MDKSEHKRVLIVEDDPMVVKNIKERLERYASDITILEAIDGGSALRLLLENRDFTHCVLVLDLMMPYGHALEELEGRNDPECWETGIRVLEWLRNHEDPGKRLWVAVTTARNEPDALHRIRELLGKHGRLFLKPFDPYAFEHSLALALGLPSKVPVAFQPRDEPKE